MTHHIHIVGAGLAGSEAAWQLARRGFRVRLSEMRGGGDTTPAHQTHGLAERVCSNSFRSDDHEHNAVGLLHHEMRELDSLVMRAGAEARVPAGSALAVDRELFSAAVERELGSLSNIEIVRERVDMLPQGPAIIATGPLTAPALAESIVAATGSDRLAFFDAIAPIVHRDSIDMSVCWMAARWDRGSSPGGGKDYINCPMTKEQYLAFHQGLLDGEKTEFREWEASTPYFEGCMPIEVMAARGVDTLRYGPMKPVGLDNPHWATPEFPAGRWPHAVVQLRQDNALEQVRLFRTIPGLENAEFARLGGLHRNTFLNSPLVLDRQLRLKAAPHIRFAGQVTGCEGYVESSAVGLLAGLMAAAELAGHAWTPPPRTTALGALLAHITGDAVAETYQPMNVNFGLFPPLPDVRKTARKLAYTERAKADFGVWSAASESVPA